MTLVAATLATYANAVGNAYVWDDHAVVESPINRAPGSIGVILTSPDVLARSQPAPYYRPLHRLSYVLDARVLGLDPRLSHAVNVGLHAMAVVLLFVVAAALGCSDAAAFLAALLLAVHPVNAEAVAFVTARNNLLVGVLVLGALLAWERARREESAPLRWVVGGLLLLGLSSKETAFMLLPFLVLWEWVRPRVEPDGRRARPSWFVPMLAASGIYLAARTAVLASTVGQSLQLSGLGAAVADDLHILPQYLRLVLWPTGLTVHHADPVAYFPGIAGRLLAWVAIGGGATLVVRQGRPVSLFGLLWFAVNFLPVSGIIPIPSAAIAERFLYIPALGLWLLAADQVEAASATARARRILPIVAGLAVAALAVGTVRRNRDWRDDEALFASALRVDPGSVDARYNLAVALLDAGMGEAARAEWERIVARDPRHVGSLAQLGTWHAQRGDLATASGYFERVLAETPRDVETRFNRAVLLERLGRREEAAAEYERWLEANPVDYPDLVPRVREKVRMLRSGAPR